MKDHLPGAGRKPSLRGRASECTLLDGLVSAIRQGDSRSLVLRGEPVGIVFAAREPGEELQHLPEMEVQGLSEGDARTLLASAVRFVLDAQVRDRIVAETRGNPLALLELPRGMTAVELAGGFGVLRGPRPPRRI